MERRLKERLIGAAVLVLGAVIFIPMLLNDTTQYNSEITESNIPERPEGEFSSRIVPLDEGHPQQEPAPTGVSGAGENATPPPPDTDPEFGKHGTDTPVVPPAGTPPVAASDAGAQEPDKEVLTGKEMGVRAWIVQLGSFSSEENAQQLNNKLRDKGFTAFVEPLKQKSRVIYRVRVGPELLRSDAEQVRDKIKQSMQMDGLVVPYP